MTAKVDCISYDYTADAPLLVALVLGYVVAHFFKTLRCQPRFSKQFRWTPATSPKGQRRACALDASVLPVEVQARVAGLAGLDAWASLSTASSGHNHYLWENDAVWAHVAKAPVGKDEFRRRACGLERLSQMERLATVEDVRDVGGMLRGARPVDNVASEFVRLFTNTAASSHSLFWKGVGSKGVTIADLGTAACARTDLFSSAQIEEISRLVGEHEELSSLCEVPELPDEDFGQTVFEDVERQLSQQYEALRVFPVLSAAHASDSSLSSAVIVGQTE